MKNTIIIASALVWIIMGCQPTQKKATDQQASEEEPVAIKEENPVVEILHESALELLDADAALVKAACGYKWTEGPLWIEEGQYLIFSDIPNNKIIRYDTTGKTSVYLESAGFTGDSTVDHQPGSNGLFLNHEGELILCHQGDRRMAKMIASIHDPRPEFETLADRYEGKRLNSPNDGVIDKEGNIYFTDPAYGLKGKDDDPAKELDFHGLYCLMSTGELRLLDQFPTPNGVALSPDESKLYVAVSSEENPIWYQYDVPAPGVVTHKSDFYVPNRKVKTDFIGLPDGMDVAESGVIYATGPGGVWVFNPEGQPLARIHVDRAAANCTLNTLEDRLYITATDCLFYIDLKTREDE